jgi:hypothetical protein
MKKAMNKDEIIDPLPTLTITGEIDNDAVSALPFDHVRTYSCKDSLCGFGDLTTEDDL